MMDKDNYIHTKELNVVKLYRQARQFPIDVFPAPILNYIKEVKESLKCPVDFICLPIISTIGIAIGNSRRIKIKNGWSESAATYSSIVGDPGTKKSPAFHKALTPIYQIEKELLEVYKKEKEIYDVEKGRYDLEFDNWTKAKTKTYDSKPEEPSKPFLKQIRTNDSTIEALSELLMKNKSGIIIVLDELNSWTSSMNSYKNGKGSDMEKYLSFWNNKTEVINRVLREPVIIDNPYVIVTGGLQPDIIIDFSKKKNNGFLDRILFAFPDAIKTEFTEFEINDATEKSYIDIIKMIFHITKTAEEKNETLPIEIPLSKYAFTIWKEWIAIHHQECNSIDLPYYLKGVWSKFDGYCARLALIIHCARMVNNETSSNEIDEVSISKASRLIEYFKSSAVKVHELINSSSLSSLINKTVTFMRKNDNKASRALMLERRIAGCTNNHDVDVLFREMAEREIGTVQEVPAKNGKGRSIIEFVLDQNYSNLED